MNSTCYSSDFLTTQEPKLEAFCERFDYRCKSLDDQLDEAQTLLDEKFITKKDENCRMETKKSEKYRTIDERMLDDYNFLRQEVFELQEFHRDTEQELRQLKKCLDVTQYDDDADLLGRSWKEQNAILVNRLMELENFKSLHRKVLTNLMAELESYEKKIEPLIESEANRQIVESRRDQEKKIECQFNAEVNRLQNTFLEKYIEVSKSKRKFEVIDWELRAEVQPKITKMTQKIFSRKEKLVKVKAELEKEINLSNEQDERDFNLKDDYKNLMRELDQLTVELNYHKQETNPLKQLISETKSTIESTKKTFRESFVELNENKMISDQISEIYGDCLGFQFSKSCNSAEKELMAVDCIIEKLKKEICRTARNIRKAEMTKVNLQDNINHLMEKGPKPVIGRDYLGSNFVQYAKNHDECGN